MSEYAPRPGDIVKFPGAPLKANQDRVYEITGFFRNVATEDPTIVFRLYCGDPVHHYSKKLSALSAIGMKLVRSVDKLDPTWNGE